jgi:hypothetical protein
VPAAPPEHAEESPVNTVTAIKDVVGVLLLAFLLPVWMALGLVAAAVVLIRQLYWWLRSNTPVVSRLATGGTAPPVDPPPPGVRRAPTPDPLALVSMNALPRRRPVQ